ncbi:MAG: hypothetical protein AB7J40_03035 [Candidatus Altimarinota bacterium]
MNHAPTNRPGEFEDSSRPGNADRIEITPDHSEINSVEITHEYFEMKFSQIQELPEVTQEERKVKNEQFNVLIKVLKDQRLQFDRMGKSTAKLNQILKDIRAQQEGLEKSIQKETKRYSKIQKVLTELASLHKKAMGKSTRAEKLAALYQLSRHIEDAPTKISAEIGMTAEDLKDISNDVQGSIGNLQREELTEQFEALAQSDEETPKSLKAKLEALRTELEKVPKCDELIKEIQQVLEEIEQEIQAKDERKRELAKSVRRAAVEAGIAWGDSVEESDPVHKKDHLVRGANILRKVILREDGSLDQDRVQALKDHFDKGSLEYQFRHQLLVVAMRSKDEVVTIDNFDEKFDERKHPDESPKDHRSPAEKADDLGDERETVLLERELNLRTHRLNVLKGKIQKANRESKDFAREFGEGLLELVDQDIDDCLQEVRRLLEKGREKSGESDESRKIMAELVATHDEGRELSLYDTQAFERLKLNRMIDAGLPEDGIVDNEAPRRVSTPSRAINRTAAWTAAAVVALFASGVWMSRRSNPGHGGEIAVVNSSTAAEKNEPEKTPIIEPEPLPPVPPIPAVDPQQLALEELQHLRKEISERMTALQNTSDVDQRNADLDKLINELKGKPGMEDLLAQAESMKERFRSEQLQTRYKQYSERLHPMIGMPNGEEKRRQLAALESDLSRETDDLFTDLKEWIAKIRDMDQTLEQLGRLQDFRMRFESIKDTRSSFQRKPLLEALITDLATGNEFPAFLAEVERFHQQNEAQIARLKTDFEDRLQGVMELNDDDAKRAALQGLMEYIGRTDNLADELPRIQELLQQVEERLLMVQTFEPRLQAVDTLSSDEDRKTALEQLIGEMTSASLQSSPTFTQAQAQLREVQQRITDANRASKPPEPTPTAPATPSVVSELERQRAEASADAARIQQSIQAVEREIAAWRNHFVLEDAQRRQQALAEKGAELQRLQTEQAGYQTTEAMLSRVLGFREESAMRQRVTELDREISELQQNLGSMQDSVRQLEAVLVRTPGEEQSLLNGRAWINHYQSEIKAREGERAVITRLLGSAHQDDAGRRK